MKPKKHLGMTVKSICKPTVSILAGAPYTKSEHTNLAERFKAIFDARKEAAKLAADAKTKVTQLKARTK